MHSISDEELKNVEIAWCWDIFDRIEEVLDNPETAVLDKLAIIRYFTKQGLKGRKE
jgi:hypothetical protein